MDNARKNVAKLRRIRYLKEAATDLTGATDQAAVLNAFLATLPAGTEVRGAPGEVYGLDSQILIEVGGLRLNGNGAKFEKLATFSGNTALRINAANVKLKYIEIDGLDKADDGIVLNAGTCSGFELKYSTIYSCLYGVSAMNNSDVTLKFNTISLCAQSCARVQNNTGAVGLRGWKVIGNTFDQSAADPLTLASTSLLVRGDEAEPTVDVHVSGNTFRLPVSPSNNAAMGCEIRYCLAPRFTDNYGEDGSMLVSIASDAGATVTANTGRGQSAYGIEIAGVGGSSTATTLTTVSGNTLDCLGRATTGIALQGSASPAAGSSCFVGSNSIKGILGTGILVHDTWDQVAIGPNVIEFAAGTGTQRAIWVSATANDIAINPGVLIGDGSADIAIQLNDVVGWSITGGVIANWPTGVQLVASGAASVNSGVISGVTFRSVTTQVATSGAGTVGSSIQVRGCPGFTRSGAAGVDVLDWLADLVEAWGTGTPESAVAAGIGSTYRRLNGGASTSLYVKESGTGNTGWVGK